MTVNLQGFIPRSLSVLYLHDGGDAQYDTADNDQINRYGATSTGT